MTIFHIDHSEELKTLPLSTVLGEWFDAPLHPSPGYVFATDRTHFYFRAAHQSPPTIHPDSRNGHFQAELWKYDVAEFFLRDPESGRYLEINLAPNGGWWSCLFTAPRLRLTDREEPAPGVETAAVCSPSGWDARIALPLDFLRETLQFGPSSRLHAAFILGSPEQRFLSSSFPAPGTLDFHRADLPTPVEFLRP